MRKLALVLAVVAVGMCSFNCGSSSSDPDPDPATAPTISSITDGNEATVALTASTGIYPTSFVVTFDTAMDDATLIADNITLTCGDLAAATLAFAIDTANTILTITPATNTLYQQLACTLAFSNSVTNADGTALAAVEYAFTNACALDDDYSNPTATQACWSVADDGPFTTWDALLADSGILSFSSLDFDGTNLTEGGMIAKSITASATSFILNIHISSVVTPPAEDADFVGIGLATNNKAVLPDMGKFITIGMGSQGNDPTCMVLYSPDGEFANVAILYADCTGSEYYLRLTVEGSTITPEYSADGVTYGTMTTAGGPGVWPVDFSATDLDYLTHQFVPTGTTASTAKIQATTTSGLTSTTMY
jgi:hypothetical protein